MACANRQSTNVHTRQQSTSVATSLSSVQCDNARRQGRQRGLKRRSFYFSLILKTVLIVLFTGTAWQHQCSHCRHFTCGGGLYHPHRRHTSCVESAAPPLTHLPHGISSTSAVTMTHGIGGTTATTATCVDSRILCTTVTTIMCAASATPPQPR
jgi:hypothetical protein